MQRAVDQILHDVCMQKLHVIFAVDRAGLVGADGETLQGCFDLSYLTMMPNMTEMAPKNAWELDQMMEFAVSYNGPVAVRYPRGTAYEGLSQYKEPVLLGKSEILHRGKELAILAVGNMVKICETVCETLRQRGLDPTFVNVRFVKPMDTALFDQLARDHHLFVTVEENVKNGGFGEHAAAYMEACHPKARVLPIAIWDRFIPHGEVESLHRKIGLSADRILQSIEEFEE